jgi:hypothetical protein
MNKPFVIGEGLRGSVTRVWEKPQDVLQAAVDAAGALKKSSQLHPVFQQAIAPFAPFLANNLTGPSPSMTKLLKKTRKSTDSFSYCLSGVDLECELDYEKASGDGWNEPHDPETATLCEAFCAGVDIIELLDDDQKAQIETAYLEQDRSDE